MKTMNMNPVSMILCLVLTTASQAQKVSESSRNEARAEAHAEASGNGTQTMKQTVTVTSDGKQTIKTTTTERNGVREVKREITDALGRVIPGGAGQADGLDPADKPRAHPRGPGETGDQDDPEDEPQNPVWIGVRVKAADPALRDQLDLAEDEGAVIELVADNGPAAKAGLKPNEIILTVDDKKISDAAGLERALDGKQEGESVALEVLSKGKKSTVQVTLEKRPAPRNESRPPEERGQEAPAPARAGIAELELDNGDSFEKILDDPQVPENFKQSVREMQQRMKEFQQKHQPR